MSHDDRFLIVQVVVLHMCFQFCSVWIASTVLASVHKEYRFFKKHKKGDLLLVVTAEFAPSSTRFNVVQIHYGCHVLTLLTF